MTNAVIWTLIVGIISTVVYYGWKQGYLEKFNAQLNKVAGGLFQDQKDLEQLWSDLQEWEARDPRNTELVWHPAATSVKYSTPNPNKEFTFISIVSPYKINEALVPKFRLHVVIEGSTGFIVQHSSVKYKRELYDNPFKSVPIVQDLKRGMISGEEVISKLDRRRVGRLGGGGYTAFDGPREIKPEPVSEDGES